MELCPWQEAGGMLIVSFVLFLYRTWPPPW